MVKGCEIGCGMGDEGSKHMVSMDGTERLALCVFCSWVVGAWRGGDGGKGVLV
jgi:hypothetical protein